MEIKELEKNERKSKLLIKGADVALINSIRRASMNYVPVFAVEDVSIYENSSVMFDEFLAHRLGLLPIKSDVKGYAENDKVKFVLEKEGPATVYSKDIKCTDPKIEVVDKKIPLVKLKKDQKIKLEMDAIMSIGKNNSKFQPIIIGYQNLPVLNYLDDMKESELNEVIKCCPQSLEIKAKKLVLKNQLDCVLCHKCLERIKGKIRLEFDENSFLFNLESHGNYSCKDVLVLASKALENKTEEFKSLLKEAL